jgi:hypothetical protein
MNNPNTLAYMKTFSKVYQIVHAKMPVYPAFASYKLVADLKKGNQVSRRYKSAVVARPTEGDGGYRSQAVVDTEELLTLDQDYNAAIYIKEFDELIYDLPLQASYSEDQADALFNQIDADILGEYDKYSLSLDAGDFDGDDGDGIEIKITNVFKVFSKVETLLRRRNIIVDPTAKFTGVRKRDSQASNRGVAVISPDFYSVIQERLEGKETILGDQISQNGFVRRYMNFDLFVSNGIACSARLDFGSTNFNDGETIVINGATLTAKTTPAAAGHFLIGANVAAAIDALVALINDSEGLEADSEGNNGAGTAGTLYYEPSQATRDLLRNVSAVDGSTYMTIKAKGVGRLTVSETSAVADIIWDPEKLVQHNLIGVADSIELVIRKNPTVKEKDRNLKLGKDVVAWTAWGKKVFHDQIYKMVDVQQKIED